MPLRTVSVRPALPANVSQTVFANYLNVTSSLVSNKLDASLAVYSVRTMEQVRARSTANREFIMLLFGAFAGLAALLAAVGLYGVLSYAVTQRRGEIGIRMALGAGRSDVSRFILREGMQPALAGVATGLAAAVFACRILKTLLFGIAPLDGLTFALAPPLLVAVSALACYLPALRATRIDPSGGAKKRVGRGGGSCHR